MANPDQALQENLVRVIQKFATRVDSLEKLVGTLAPTGVVVTHAAQGLRSGAYAQTRKEAVGDSYTTWWPFHDLTAPVTALGGAQQGVLHPTATPANQPKLARPGNLPSDGGYSIYFPGLGTGATTSRIELPLQINTQNSWTTEIIFTPELSSQHGYLVVNGTTNAGWYVKQSNAAGNAAGNSLVMGIPGSATLVDLGFTVTAGVTYHLIITRYSGGGIAPFLGSYNPTTKAFAYTAGAAPAITPAAGTTRTEIGGSVLDGRPFTGTIDEALFWLNSVAAGVAEGRIRGTLQPAAPQGWVPAYGTAVSRQKFAQLFRVIGTTHGAGDGTTTFNLPTVTNGIVKV